MLKAGTRPLLLGAVFAVLFAGMATAASQQKMDYNIAAQPTEKALVAFATVTGLQILFPPDLLRGHFSPPLIGAFTQEEALDRLLEGTGLAFDYAAEDVLVIRKKSDGAHADRKHPAGARFGALEAARDADVSLRSNAHEGTAGEGEEIEEIITVGTRSKGRGALATPVPVDVMTESAILSTGGSETGRILQALAPSFNFPSSTISDGTDALRPATLRGLGPDQTLVLINGKRRHASALVHVNTSVGRGTSGVDINAIVPSAIARVEILRDGASAQYGSDAIAGVINFVLKARNEGGGASLFYGQTYDGDGDTVVASGNAGFAIGKDGYLNITTDYRYRGRTNRAGLSAAQQYPLLPDGSFDPREFTFARRNFRVGDAESEQGAVFVNAGLPLAPAGEIYIFGGYSDRENQSAGFYRRAVEFDRTVTALYPDGFLPLINTDIEDYSLTGGLKWAFNDGWSVDVSLGTGGNAFNFFISNSLNASLGEASPTMADAGTLKVRQSIFNLDAVKTFPWHGRDATIAMGTEFRSENYKIVPGVPVSYLDGGALNSQCPGCVENPIRYAPGFQVFRGFSPANAVDESRSNVAVYADIELWPGEALMLGLASRFETYSDFGGAANGKLSLRYQAHDGFALRGSASTGFRAPSLQQQFFNSVSTQFVEVGGEIVVEERGTFRNDSAVARALGIPKLREERSLNLSAGFVATPAANLSLTVDFYRIVIDDRIVITGSFSNADPRLKALLEGTGASAAQFFTNAVDTRTRGLDITASYDIALGGGGEIKLLAAANWTDTDITGDVARPDLLAGFEETVFTAQDRSIIEAWQPASRVNISANYTRGPFDLVLRLSRYGAYKVCEGRCDRPAPPEQNIQKFGAKLLTDVQMSYHFGGGFSLTLGANNLFGVTPDKNLIGQTGNGILPGIVESDGVFTFSRRSAPFGFNGGFYYARASYGF
ncbi:MAG: TonB-dependent receptor domain-containing protein [Pseudomonadota bacterium]